MSKIKAKLMAATRPTQSVKSPKIKSVFVDGDGEKLETDTDIADAYRDAVNDLLESETKLGDDEIVAIVRGIMGDETGETGAAVREERLKALAEASGPRVLDDLTAPSAVQSDIATLAIKYGSMIDAETDAALETAADSKEEMDGAPLLVADHFATLWGGERDEHGYITRVPAVDEMPIPGSSKRNSPANSNRPLDRYSWYDHSTGKERPGHFVGNLVDSMPAGIKLLQDISDLTIPSQKGYSKDAIKNPEYKTEDFLADKAGCRSSTLDRMKARRASRIRAAGRAISFLQVVNRLDAELPKLKWRFTLPEGGTRITDVARLRKPVQFWTEGRDGGQIPPWSLSQFINLQLVGSDGVVRLDQIKQRGGKLSDVSAVLQRKPKGENEKSNQGGGNDTLGKDTPIPSPEQLEAFANMFTSGMDAGDAEASSNYRNRIMAYLNVQTPDRDETLTTLDDMRFFLNTILSHYTKRITRIREKTAEAIEADAATSETKKQAVH
jgi:hypothetical protein